MHIRLTAKGRSVGRTLTANRLHRGPAFLYLTRLNPDSYSPSEIARAAQALKARANDLVFVFHGQDGLSSSFNLPAAHDLPPIEFYLRARLHDPLHIHAYGQFLKLVQYTVHIYSHPPEHIDLPPRWPDPIILSQDQQDSVLHTIRDFLDHPSNPPNFVFNDGFTHRHLKDSLEPTALPGILTTAQFIHLTTFLTLALQTARSETTPFTLTRRWLNHYQMSIEQNLAILQAAGACDDIEILANVHPRLWRNGHPATSKAAAVSPSMHKHDQHHAPYAPASMQQPAHHSSR